MELLVLVYLSQANFIIALSNHLSSPLYKKILCNLNKNNNQPNPLLLQVYISIFCPMWALKQTFHLPSFTFHCLIDSGCTMQIPFRFTLAPELLCKHAPSPTRNRRVQTNDWSHSPIWTPCPGGWTKLVWNVFLWGVELLASIALICQSTLQHPISF